MHQDLLDLVFLHREKKSSSSQASTAFSSAAAATMANRKGAAGADDEQQQQPAASCPVDHKSREAWLAQAQAQNRERESSSSATQPIPPPAAATGGGWTWRIPFLSSPSPPPPPSPPAPARTLGTDRAISSIPRSSTPGPSSCPVNHEVETGADAATGNWVYPSEKMFFEAMKRKGFDSARAADMQTVVPIHNAVNERAWAEIQAWEAAAAAAAGGAKCAQGPRLHSFTGVKDKMTPRARFNTLLGYAAPFDRHDWVVDRCGTRVEYVIDFYAGRQDPKGKEQGQVSFYLDVRPKLNTWEGVRMRVLRGVGIV